MQAGEDPGASFAVGDLLLGKLRVTRELGHGGMGQVFEVVHELTRHHRALKVLHPRLRSRDDVVQRFLKEASAAGRIGNRHIAETFDAGFLPDGSVYLLMELLSGSPLSAYLHAAGRLDVPEAAAIAVQCCEALQAAHEARIVHRDVKPDNLFLVQTAPVFVKVLDFGIAHFDATDTQPGHILGTPLYMAPEQFLGTGIDARTDLYALGVVLYELLAGRLPWQQESLGALSQQVVEGRLTRLSEVRPDLPPALSAVVQRCMAVDPAQRFPDALSLRAALEPFAAHQPQRRAPAEDQPADGDTFIPASPAPPRAAPRLFAVPRPTDRFVGRVPERERLVRDLDGHVRLVVVVGPAGAGKTRLVVETLWGLQQRGAAFVDAADVTDGDGLCSAVARALSIPIGDARIDSGAAVGAALAERPDFILALDNLEQALPAVEPLLRGWLAAAPGLTLLVTSRLRLSLSEATHHEVSALHEAVELLVERVRAVRGSFEVTPEDTAALTAIVGEADALPLAVELAASQMLVLTPQQLLARMRDHLAQPTRQGAGKDRRSRLRTAIDSSWRLLSAAEQTALAQLSVFFGGCEFATAERVLELHPDGPGLLELTEALVAHSLLNVTSAGGAGPRLTMLKTVQEYARHELLRAGKSEAARLRHAREYAGMAALVRDPSVPPDSPPVLATLQREQANLSAALEWAETAGSPECRTLAALLAIALDPLLALRGHYEKRVATLQRLVARLEGVPSDVAEELRLVHVSAFISRDRTSEAVAALALVPEPRDAFRRARWLILSGFLAVRTGAPQDARVHFAAALTGARACGSRYLAGRALHQQGNRPWGASHDARAALALFEAGLAEAVASNDRRLEGMLRGNLGSVLSDLREVLPAREFLTQALRIHEEMGNRRGAAVALTNLGILSLDEGDLEAADRFLHESLSFHREVANQAKLGVAQARLSACALLRGDRSAARALARESLENATAGNDADGQAAALAFHAFASCADGNVEEAEALVARATSLLPAHSSPATTALVVLAKAGPAAAAGDFGAARELMRGFLVSQAGGLPPLASRSDEVRLGLRCAAVVVKRLEESRFAQV